MCEDCFPDNLPDKIRESYRRRKWEFTMDGETKGKIGHVILHEHVHKRKRFWKGVERLQFYDDHRIEYRFMYFARRKKDKEWTWGQFCPMLPSELLKEILSEMRKHNWL